MSIFLSFLLNSFKKKKIIEKEYLRALQKVFPQEYFDKGGINYKFLLDILIGLEEENAIKLPEGDKYWNVSQIPTTPKWFRVLKEAKSFQPWKSYPWRQELQWATDLWNGKHFADLVILNNALKDPSLHNGIPIPIKERSLLIFKDEKKLDELLKTQIFRKDRLTLRVLNCYQTHPPLLLKKFQAFSNLRTIMIENRDTFFSLCLVCNEMEPNSPFKYVIYGKGYQIERSILGIKEQYPDINVIEYFGDLDPPGLKIPILLQKVSNINNISIKIIPASFFYKTMIELFQKNPFESLFKKENYKWKDIELNFLPEELREFTKELFQNRKRIPQEIMNIFEIKKIMKLL